MHKMCDFLLNLCYKTFQHSGGAKYIPIIQNVKTLHSTISTASSALSPTNTRSIFYLQLAELWNVTFTVIFPYLCLCSGFTGRLSLYSPLNFKSFQVPCQSCLLHKSFVILFQYVLVSLCWTLMGHYQHWFFFFFALFLIFLVLLCYQHDSLTDFYWIVCNILNSVFYLSESKYIGWFKLHIFQEEKFLFRKRKQNLQNEANSNTLQTWGQSQGNCIYEACNRFRKSYI